MFRYSLANSSIKDKMSVEEAWNTATSEEETANPQHSMRKAVSTQKPESTIHLSNFVNRNRSPVGQTLTLPHLCYHNSQILTNPNRKLHSSTQPLISVSPMHGSIGQFVRSHQACTILLGSEKATWCLSCLRTRFSTQP